MPTKPDIERIKKSFQEYAEIAILHRNRKGGEDTLVSLSPYDVTTLLADHDLKVKQLRAAMDALRLIATEHQAYYSGPALSPESAQYSIGYTDGHRCAAKHARPFFPELFPAEGAETGGGE